MDGAPFAINLEGPWSGFTLSGPTVSIAAPSPSSRVVEFPVGAKVTIGFFSTHAYYAFSPLRAAEWRGPCVPAPDSCDLTLDDDVTVTAVIEPRIVVHYVLAGSVGAGTVRSDGKPPDNPFYRYDYLRPGNEIGVEVLERGQVLTLTPVAAARSHVGQWTGLCAAAGSGPCRIVATPDNQGGEVTIRFDPDIDPRYRLAAVVPLMAQAMKAGRVAGAVYDSGRFELYVYDLASAKLTKLPIAGTNDGEVRAINRRGDVVGRAGGHSFVAYASGRIVVLDSFEGKHFSGELVAIDDAGVMVGNDVKATYDPSGWKYSNRAFSFDGTTVTWLAAGFIARALNGNGVIVGSDASGNGAIYRNGQLVQTSTRGLVAINSRNVAAGAAVVPIVGTFACTWDTSQHVLPGLWLANDIDDAGNVVGALDVGGRCTQRASCTYEPRLHAAIFTGGVAEDLNYLVDLSADKRVPGLGMATAIDDQGRILVPLGNISAVLEPNPVHSR
jgi:hypothetical protein